MTRPATALALCLVACSDSASPSGSGISITRTPNGATFVQNGGRGLWENGEKWTLEREITIGSVVGGGPDQFGSIGDIEVDPLGRIYVADRHSNEVRVFSPDGEHIRTLGRAGYGPGEFDNIMGMAWSPEGNLWVVDLSNGYVVFDTTGAFVETKRRPTLIGLRPWPGALGSEGEVFDIAPDYAGASFQPLLVRYSNDFSTTDTIALPKYSGINFELTGSDGRRRMVAAVPFTPYLVWRLDPTGHIWSGVTGSYRIAKQTLTGDTLLVFDKRYIPVSVTNADLEAAIERLQGFVNSGGRIDESLIPSVKPAFVAIYIDDRSHVWVRLSAASESEPYISFDVFDPNGRYLGLIRTELRGGSPLIIRGDRMYAVGLDELDVPYVIRLAIRGRASDEAVAP